MDNRLHGTLQMITAMVISGSVGWFVLKSGQAVHSVVFWRCAFGALFMLLVCAYLRLIPTFHFTRQLLGLTILGGCALIMNWGLLFAAFNYTSISIATIIYHTQPFMLVALGSVLFREKVTRNHMLWLSLAFLGLIAIITARNNPAQTEDHALTGVVLALGAAFFYAAAALISKRLKTVPPYLIAFVQLLTGAIALLPFAGMPSNTQGWSVLVFIGVVHTGIMLTLLYGAIQRIPLSLVGVLSFIYPVVAIVIDWVAFGIRMNTIQLCGTGAILLAAAAMNSGWNPFGSASERA